MKNIITLIICLINCLSLHAQNLACQPDTEFATVESFVFPLPLNPATGQGGIEMYPACIGEPYELVLSLRTGDSATIQGISLDFIHASIDTVGAIEGLPEGINYYCNPPDCVFADTTLGCIVLKGIPTENTPIDTHQLKIFASVKFGAYGTIHTSIPGDIIDFQYNLVVNNPQECRVVSTEDPLKNSIQLRNSPNPVLYQTNVEITSLSDGDFLFQIYDMTGKLVHQESIILSTGYNSFTYDAFNLKAGTYIYSISNAISISTQKMIVGRR